MNATEAIRWFNVETASRKAALSVVAAALSDEGYGPDDHTLAAGAAHIGPGLIVQVRVRATPNTPAYVEQAARARRSLDELIVRQAVEACHERFAL